MVGRASGGLTVGTSERRETKADVEPAAASPSQQVSRPLTTPSLGVYLHMPFCSAICHYCNFNRGLFDGALKDAYIDAIEKEIRRGSDSGAVDSIYFGGGTPSLLAPDEIARLIGACNTVFELAGEAEITLEVNPETVTPDRLSGYRAAGINRLSMGVQSFRDEELVRLGRVHSADRASQAFATARQAGFDNVSLDLMLWLPEQSVAQWLESVEAAIALGPDHISMYMLELYPNAPLRDEMARGGWSQAPDEDAAEMYLMGLAHLEAAGYQQYEISNLARPNRACRHNEKYWTDGEWMAFGCGAHGTRHGRRWKNVSQTTEYIRRVQGGEEVASEIRTLSSDERLEEALFMGLRLTRGLDLQRIHARFGVDVWDRYGRALAPFIDVKLVEHIPPVLRLTRQGMLLANEVCSVFV
jgi:oxygen-independent coproporphyrinogen III oxidase